MLLCFKRMTAITDKESYHPVISRMLQLNGAENRYAAGIREVWLIDLPNHGESAALNRALLDDRKDRGRREGWEGRCSAYFDSALLDLVFPDVPDGTYV